MRFPEKEYSVVSELLDLPEEEMEVEEEMEEKEEEEEAKIAAPPKLKAVTWPVHPPRAEKFPKGPPGTPGGWLESDPLPKADVLVITWTADEWKALNDVLAPDLATNAPENYDGNWRDLWYPYTRNFYKVYPKLWNHRLIQWQKGLSQQTPSLNQERGVWYHKGIFGSFCLISIAERTVLLFHSCLHLNTDGRMIPLVNLIEQIIEETEPDLILSVGTAGGVNTEDNLGDVLVSNKALFHLSDEFSDADINHQLYTSSWNPPQSLVNEAEALMEKVEEGELWLPSPPYSKLVQNPIIPKTGIPKIKISDKPIITTDTFEYGTTSNNLDKIGCIVEMGDALVAKVCSDHGIPFGFIRNVSDPVINAELDKTLQISYATEVYKKYGYSTSRNSAIAVWAMIAGEGKEPNKMEPPLYVEPIFIPEKEEEGLELPPILWEDGEPRPECAPLPDPPESFKDFSAYKDFKDWNQWAPLPEADVLLFVWTQKAFEALHHVMIGHIEPVDKDGTWEKNWQTYNRNSHTILRELYLQKQLQRDRTDYLSPEGLSTGAKLGKYRIITIKEKKVVLFYSPLSIRTDGATLPLERMVHQVLSEVNPTLVLSVGTAAAVEGEPGLGSVLVTNSARFLLGNEFRGYSLNGEVFGSNWAAPTTYKEAAEKKMKKVRWLEVKAPSVAFMDSMPETPLIPPDQEPKIHFADQPMITAPRRESTGFFYIKLFKIGTTENNLNLLGCGVDTHDAVVARQCSLKNVDCGFVRAISVPVMNATVGKTNAMRSWAQVFEEQLSSMCSYNSVVAAWSFIAGYTQ